MRINRKFLYAGVFLAAIGGVVVAADLTTVDGSLISDALRLWPLAIVAIGLAIAFRRTQFGLPAGLLAAAVPGLVIGGGFALVPRVMTDCGVGGPPSAVTTEQGSFDGSAQVFVSTGCGSLTIDTAPGAGWRFERGESVGQAPTIATSARMLSIDAVGQRWWHRFDDDRDTWHLTLPTSQIDDLSVVVNAGEGQVSLPGAHLGRLELTTNAGSTTVDLSETAVEHISSMVNAGAVTYRLPGTDLTGSFEVNAGALEICAPSDLGLRVRRDADLGEVAVNGQELGSTDWQSPNYASALHRADLSVEVNFGSVEINPTGGCK